MPCRNNANAVIHADDRGEGWDANACQDPAGIFRTLLEQVPYNTSAAWISAYPDLPNILNDTPCRAKYNVIQGNTVCNIDGLAFIDVSNATFSSWSSTISDNAVICA